MSPAESWNHALTRDGTWQRVILLDDGWCSKNIDRVEFMRVRFWLASYERLDIRSAKYKHKYSLNLDRFKTKCNVDDVFNEHSVYIQYNNYWLHERVTWEIVTPRKPISTSASSRWALVLLLSYFWSGEYVC